MDSIYATDQNGAMSKSDRAVEDHAYSRAQLRGCRFFGCVRGRGIFSLLIDPSVAIGSYHLVLLRWKLYASIPNTTTAKI